MKSLTAIIAIIAMTGLPALAEEAPPAQALRYHEALLKRPANATLYDRFLGAWLDEQSIESLDTFLADRAAASGGPDTAILARHHLRRGRENEALDALQIAITALPDDPSLPFERAKILMRRLEFAAARQDLAPVASGTDATLAIEAAKLTGRSHLREGNTEQAIKTWDALLASNPGDEDLLEDLVESAATEGEIQQAIAYAEKLIAATNDPYRKTLRLIRRGDLLAQAGSTDEAIAAYTSTLADVGESSWLEREILAQISQVFRKQDRIGDLMDELAKLAAAHPGRFLIHRELATLEVAQGEVDAAVGRFREILQRSPGNRELREEFIRLLADGGKFDDAAAELEKIIELTPEDSGLHLQMAELRHQQGEAPLALAALNQAHKLLGNDEPGGLRIASLMLQYGATTEAEALLTKLTESKDASSIPAETLAAEYARTNRKAQAIDILEKIAATAELDTILRVTGSISAMGELEKTLAILNTRASNFPTEPAFLTAIARAAMAANQPEEAIPHAITRLRLASHAGDLGESINLATRAITAADQIPQWRESLANQENRTLPETCLLAALAESQADFDEVARLLTPLEAPLALRFHATLLDLRGEFDNAITTLLRLADTEEGRKATFFKELSDLQTRAGNHDDALATIERWKQSAPGDKSAWITGGELLRQIGRPDDAVRTIRQAVGRFEGDADLTARLANLHEEAGQFDDAAALFWRLYDDAASPSEQARWAVQLAKLAVTTGQTDELEEKFRERAAGNRRSIGPILAQVELARARNDDDKRRDLLMDALRLQPTDVDLRLQIAQLEEQSGNLDRVIAILQEAVDTDPSNRIRAALAQAYIRQGQTMKGMRELRAMAGKQADDPRAIESTAATLAGSGLYEEAIRYLREALPDGGDWRTKYLLAIMLEHDGLEAEAIPLFEALRQATGELENVTPASRNVHRQQHEGYPAVQKLSTLIRAAQGAYFHRSTNHRHGGGFHIVGSSSRVGTFILPDSAEIAQTYALIHLAELNIEGVENGDFIREIISLGHANRMDYPALLAKFPAQPGLLELVLMFAHQHTRGIPIDPDLLRNLIAEKDDLPPIDKFRAHLILASSPKAADEDWENLISSVRSASAAANKDSLDLLQIGSSLLRLISDKELTVPEKARGPLSESLLAIASMEDLNVGYFEGFRLIAINNAGTLEQWIAAANAEVEHFQNDDKRRNQPSMAAQMRAQMHGNNPWGSREPFALPSIPTIELSSLPDSLLNMLSPPTEQNFYGYGFGESRVDPKQLLDHLDSFASPLLRTYIAIRADDETSIEKSLAATFPAIEAADAQTLRALCALEKKDYPQAYRLLSETRPALASDRTRITSLNFSLLAIAAEMDEEQREEISADLRALLLQARRSIGAQNPEILATQAENLGFPELAKRFVPTANRNVSPQSAMRAARFGSQPIRTSSGSGGTSTVERMKKFAADGKNEAAALEALQIVRNLQSSPFGRNHALRELTDAITPHVTEALFKHIDPGDSGSLTKLLEYADICLIFNKTENALAVLRRLHAERPQNPQISGQLAFLLPADQRDMAVDLIAIASSDARFPDIASTFAMKTLDANDPARILDFFTTVASWLEATAPEHLNNANLTWVAFHGKNFFERPRSQVLVGLRSEAPENVRDKEEYKHYVNIAKRLALAMTQHGSIAEEGFRLLRFSAAWKLPDEQLDALARDVLMAASVPTGHNIHHPSFFTLRLGNSSSSSGGDLSEHSSTSWLTTRLASAENPEKVLPPNFLATLRERNPHIGRLTDALANLSEIGHLEELWKSDTLKNVGGRHSDMLTQALFTRAATIAGASTFFLDRLRELNPGSISQTRTGRSESGIQLVSAALSASASAKPDELEAIASAISEAIYGKDFIFESGVSEMVIYQSVSVFESIIRESKLDPAAAARIHGTFFRLGIPVASNDYYLHQSFQSLRFKTVEEAAKFLAECGWLDDAQTWQPFAAVTVDAEHNTGRFSLTRKESFLLPQVLSRMKYDFPRSNLVKHLENRQPQTFGSLITAASISSGNERARLTELAFKTAAPKLQNLPPERIRNFSTVLPWLPESTLTNLPPALGKVVEDANAARLAEIQKTADHFLKNSTNSIQSVLNPLDEVEELVRNLAPLDLDKAVAVLLEAERRFTDSLTRGGTLSTFTSGSLQITERDEALEDLLRDSDNPLGTDIPLALRFHTAIAASPEATRFAFSRSSNGLPLLCSIGGRIHNSPTKEADANIPSWLLAMREIESMPQDVQNDAYVALACYMVADRNLARNVKPDRDREDLANRSDLPEKMRKLRSLTIGISGWMHDDDEGRKSTATAFAAFAGDQDVLPVVRFQFASIALSMMPQMLDNSLIAETFTSMYESYSEGERSIVNALGLNGLRNVSLSMPTEQNKPYLIRINDAFWKNANAPKKGGHPAIPPESGGDLFMAAAAAGDEANAKRLMASVRPLIEGKLHVISFLIANGHHEMAKRLLAPPHGMFHSDADKPSATYDSAFEQQMADFRKTPGLDPLDLLRFEAHLKGKGPFPTGPNKPTESESAREQRLADAYRANPPTSLLDRAGILSALICDSHTAAILLREEILALRDELDLAKALEDWNRGSSDDQELELRYFFAPIKAVIFRQAAFLEFLEGDLAGLENLVEAITNEPEHRKRFGGHGDPGYLQSYLSSILQFAPIWICEAAHRGKTEGFKDGFDVFRKFFLLTQERSEMRITEMFQCLAVAEYLAYWAGEGEKFKQLKNEVKRETNRLNYFDKPEGIFRMAYNGKNHPTWRHESFAKARNGFLRHSFTRKEMRDLYSHNQHWLPNSAARHGLRGDILEIAANPPEDILPTVLPHLLQLRGKQEFRDGKFDEAVLTSLAAIEACPEDCLWIETRHTWRMTLAEKLLEAEKLEEAKELFSGIETEGMNQNQIRRHKQLGTRIDKTTQNAP